MTEMSTNRGMNKPIIVSLYNIIPHNKKNNKLLLNTLDSYQKTQYWSKKPSPLPKTHTVWFHLNSIWKQAKLISGDRSKDRSYI